MPTYVVRAIHDRTIIDVASVGTAKLAIIKFLDAADQYPRAWVCDESGKDVLFDELARLADEG